MDNNDLISNAYLCLNYQNYISLSYGPIQIELNNF